MLNDRLSEVEENLARKYATREEYDKTIKDTELAYHKVAATPNAAHLFQILESSQALLQLLKRETAALSNKKDVKRGNH